MQKYINPDDPENVRGFIFDIQRFSIHDGPGIRTNIFLKGCPLNCAWCHNPESVDRGREIAYYPSKCGFCGACASVCPAGLHSFPETGGHAYLRDGCSRCGKCAEACVYGALSSIGRDITAGEALAEVKKDQPFYDTSGGGLTLSGGEPFYQPDFTLALLRLAKGEGLHACVETSGAVSRQILEAAACFTDIFLYDIKETSSERHRRITGAPNELITENLEALNALGASIVLRCPIIPGLNDYEGHFQKLGELADKLVNVRQIDIEPYHPLGLSKSEAIGKTARHADAKMPAAELSEKWAETLRNYTSAPVCIS